MKLSLRDEVNAYRSELIALRREFHRYPEPGYKEFRTSKLIYDYLKSLGFDTVSNVCKTGVVGVLNGRRSYGRTVMLRVSIDGNPIREQTGVEYASLNPGMMHAGGKDAQMAVSLVVAKLLKRHREEFDGRIKLVFQPNEEVGGALDMIGEHLLEDPAPDCALAMHFTSMLGSGTIGLSSGLVLGNIGHFVIHLKGNGGTTYLPHISRDTILGAARIVESMHLLESRFADPFSRISVMFGKIEGGTADNVTPSDLRLEGTVRYLSQEPGDFSVRVEEEFRRIVEESCRLMHLEYDVQFIGGIPSLRNDPEIVGKLYPCARLVCRRPENIADYRSLMSEDFAEIAARIPSVMTFFGVSDPEKGCIYPNNHAKYNIDEDVMTTAAEYFFRAVTELLKE